MNYRLTHHFDTLCSLNPRSVECRISIPQILMKTGVTLEKRLIRTGCLKWFDLHGAVIFSDTDALITSAFLSQSSPIKVCELVEPCDIFNSHPDGAELSTWSYLNSKWEIYNTWLEGTSFDCDASSQCRRASNRNSDVFVCIPFCKFEICFFDLEKHCWDVDVNWFAIATYVTGNAYRLCGLRSRWSST